MNHAATARFCGPSCSSKVPVSAEEQSLWDEAMSQLGFHARPGHDWVDTLNRLWRKNRFVMSMDGVLKLPQAPPVLTRGMLTVTREHWPLERLAPLVHVDAHDRARPKRDDRPILYPSPRGEPLTQAMARQWAAGPGLIVFCGRFEGLDERVIEARRMREICVGDAVLAGGEAAALVMLEATIRLLPGVLGNEGSLAEESFDGGLLEQAHYTRPHTWEGRDIPAILTSGDHAKVEAWRKAERERLTRERRPDLKSRET